MQASSRVSLATAPLLWMHFGTLSTVTIISNVLAIPVAMALLLAALLAIPLALVCGTLPLAVVWVLEQLGGLLCWLAGVCAALPWAQLVVAPPTRWWTAACLLLACWVLAQPRALAAWGLLLLALGWVLLPPEPPALQILCVRTPRLCAVVVCDGPQVTVLGRSSYALDRFLLSQGLVATRRLPLHGRVMTSRGLLQVDAGLMGLPGCGWNWGWDDGVHRWSWGVEGWQLEAWGDP